MQFHALTLNSFHAAKGFHQMALHPGVGLSLIAQLPTDDWGGNNRETHEERNNSQGPEGELHAIEQHDSDINQREAGIQNDR